MSERPRTHEEYLATVNAEQRASLERLRRITRDTAPEAVECISYQLPAFRLHGKLLVGYGAARKHCALYLMGATTVGDHAEELRGYDTSKGTIRFKAGGPLPDDLVRRLVQTRMAEDAGERRLTGPGNPGVSALADAHALVQAHRQAFLELVCA